MNKKKVISIASVIAVPILLYVLYTFISGANAKELVQIDAAQVQKSHQLLYDTLDYKRNPYTDFFTSVSIDYTLPSATGTLVSDSEDGLFGYEGKTIALKREDTATYEVNVEKDGYYNIVFDHYIDESVLSNITLSVAVNGEIQFDEAKQIDVQLRWKDETKEFGLDSYGDETVPNQVRISEWKPLDLFNNTYASADPLLFKLQKGKNTIEITNLSSNDIYFGEMTVKAPKKILAYAEYKESFTGQSPDALYTIDAIDYTEKNSSFVRMSSYKSPSVAPFDSVDKKINIIDGAAWRQAGQEVSFPIEVQEDGFYQLAFHYFNNKDDFSVFRTIKIDGEIPFIELQSYEFDNTGEAKWSNKVITDSEGTPYQVYLTKGTHTLSMKAESNKVAKAMADMQLLIDHINQFSLEIRKITGKDIDRNRTWTLTRYLPETADVLQAYEDVINGVIMDLQVYAPNGANSSTISYLRKAIVKLDLMQKDPDELPLYFEDLYSGTGSVTQMLGDTIDRVKNQPLFLDEFYVYNNEKLDSANAGFLTKLSTNVTSLVATFTTKKYVIKDDPEAINIWVSRPITYIDTMQKMVDSKFTPETGIKVKISVMPDASKMILANAAGQSPDVALGLLSYMPYDFAIRGVAYDLTQFDDFWKIAGNSAPGAFIPYILNDGVYAIPETLDFNALVYRKDILRSLSLDVPDTWEDVIGILPSLQRYGMNFYHPIAGGIAIKWFYQTSAMLYQYDGKLYSPDGLTTAINDPKSVEGLTFLSDLFTTYSLDEQIPNFYNNFRYGTTPIGVTDFNTYLTIKNAAPELKGQWELSLLPGVKGEDGTVNRSYIANGTGAVIMNTTDKPDQSWEFIKWWTSTEIQTEYAYLLQSTYGPEFVWLSGNINAVKNAPIDETDKAIIEEMIPWLRDVPRTPGQYMLERGISDIWNKAVFDGVIPRVAIDQQSIIINREFRKKLIEFGYLDEDGNVVKPYIIRDVDWIKEQIEKARGDSE